MIYIDNEIYIFIYMLWWYVWYVMYEFVLIYNMNDWVFEKWINEILIYDMYICMIVLFWLIFE